MAESLSEETDLHHRRSTRRRSFPSAVPSRSGTAWSPAPGCPEKTAAAESTDAGHQPPPPRQQTAVCANK